jgi:hypothetical protein
MKQSAQKKLLKPVHSCLLFLPHHRHKRSPVYPCHSSRCSVCLPLPPLRPALRCCSASECLRAPTMPRAPCNPCHPALIPCVASPRALPRLTHCSARRLVEFTGTHTLLIACEAHVDATRGARALLVAHGARPALMKPALSSPHRHPRR